MLLTDDEQRARERQGRARIDTALEPQGLHVCPGYVDRTCITLIPWTATRCRYCARQAIRDRMAATGINPVADLLELLPPVRVECECGGDPDNPQHEQSLLHRHWVTLGTRWRPQP